MSHDEKEVSVEIGDLVEENSADVEILEESDELDLAATIEKLTQEKEAVFKSLLTSEADMKNLTRRVEIDVANAHKFALEKFVKELLPCVDALEYELNAVTKLEGSSEDLDKFKEGSELTYRMLLNALEKFGVVQFNPVGEVLNPEFHQAVTLIPNTGKASNEIVEVVQKGYLLNERLIRAAQVIVAQ